MKTAGRVYQDTPVPDLQIFVPATVGATVATGAPPVTFTPSATYVGISPAGGTAASQIPSIAIAASATANIKFDLTNLLLRTGIFQDNVLGKSTVQEAFGTANGPGPTSTPGTSDPSGFGYGSSQIVDSGQGTSVITSGSNTGPVPVAAALLPTLNGPNITKSGVNAGPNLTRSTIANTKGTRIKWIDLIYRVQGVALTSLALTLYKYNFLLASDGSVGWDGGDAINHLTGAQLAINSAINKVHRERCTILDLFGNPAQFIVTDGSSVGAYVSFQTPAGSTANLLGMILGCDYNFN